MIKRVNPLLNIKDRGKEKYLQIFIISFFILFIIFLPTLIVNNGYLIYYGDFNSQQIPFYHLAHNAVRSGNIFWHWGTDLGANFIGSYSFYLLCSPFFWLTLLFKSSVVPYLMSVLLCLKHSVAAVTAYAYIRRFVRNKNAALIGGLIYSFSGFQAYNLFFNHFQDVTAFFPLLLIALEERVNNNRRGVFALSVAFMAMLNYFFFTGQVVFVVLYFLVRLTCDDFKINKRKFFSIAFEAIIGVMLAAVILMPSALAILGNYRIEERLYGTSLIAYNDKTIVWRIIQSFFMIPDVPARPNLFSSESAKWSSIAGYLPLFSMAGVIAFIQHKRKHWASKLIIICAIMAVVPVLNSSFYMFNSSYYARWYYMPILIMAMVTAYSLDNREISFKKGIATCAIMLSAFGLISLLPQQIDEKTKWLSLPNDQIYFYITLFVSVANLAALVYITSKRKLGKPFMKSTVLLTAIASLVCTSTVFYYGVSIGPYPKTYGDIGINGKKKISLESNDDEFYRIDISEHYDNYPMLWDLSSMRTFHSIVPASIMEFYSEIGISRDVASRAPTSSYTLRGLFSVKYYFDKVDIDDKELEKNIDLPGFEYYDTQNEFNIYENKYYIPMGFTYDYYIDEETIKLKSQQSREKLLMKAVLLDDNQVDKYSDIMEPIPEDSLYNLSEMAYLEECKLKSQNACESFEYATDGFIANINLKNDSLVFFSVPYDAGWTASVNGKPIDIERVNYGFMAVKADRGDNIIEFAYEPEGLRYGLYITIGGALLLVAYLIIAKRFKHKELSTHTHYYDYSDSSDISVHKCFIDTIKNK
ncbi:MAG: YfhO family protein [Clostridiales bacterium]|nr:YfhO family protein [Clostridiales bacterium]